MPKKRRHTLAIVLLACSIAGGALAAGGPLDPGLKAMKAGKLDAAIKAFTEALATKSTAGPDLAKAYYYRGVAYSKAGKPAQTIADLTNALWLKGGLTDGERQAALTTRAAAYEQMGIAARAQADLAEAARLSGGAGQQPAGAAAATAPAGTGSLVAQPQAKATKMAVSSWQANASTSETVAPPLAAVPAADASTASSSAAQSNGGVGGFFSNLFSSGSSDNPADATTATSSSSRRDDDTAGSVRSGARTRDDGTAPSTGTSSAAAITPQISAQAPMVAAAPVSAQIPAAPAVVAASTKTKQTAVDAPAEEPAAWQTSIADVAPAPATVPAPASAPVAESSSGIGGFFQSIFGGSSSSAGRASDKTETASIAVPSTSASTTGSAEALPWSASANPAATEAHMLQVASVRSPDEAKAIVAALQQKQGPLLATHAVSPEIVPQVLGSMGTFYQVTLGPFADERTSLKACNGLKRSGFDCFLMVR